MRRVLTLAFFGICLAAAILYASDYAWVHFGRTPLGTVIVTRYYLIPQKNGKTQIVFRPPELQKCVHSLFSHQGYSPCWYLNKHTEQPTRM